MKKNLPALTHRPLLLTECIYFFIVLASLPFVLGFRLTEIDAYHPLVLAVVISDLFFSLAILIVEGLALRFDRTATRNTTFAALGILLALVTSADFAGAFARLGAGSPIYESYIRPFFHMASVVAAFYFMLRFFARDYGVKNRANLFLIPLSALGLASAILHAFSLSIPSLICAIAALSLGVGLSLYSLIRSFGKDNLITALLAFCMVFSFAVSGVFGALFEEGVSAVEGYQAFFLLPVYLAFFLIYAVFLLDKTKKVYDAEDEAKKKKEAVRLKVRCFHGFDVFLRDEVLDFPSKKSKEFFALLVMMEGKSLSMDKAITYLYPDKDYDLAKISYRDIIWKLRHFLDEIHFQGVEFLRGKTILKREFIDCDYYDALADLSTYAGDPLCPEYEWSLEFENRLN